MTFEEMRLAFETYTGTHDEVDNAQLALWLNEAQLDLAYELGVVQSVSVTAAAGDVYTPNADWLRVVASSGLDFCRAADGTLTFISGGEGKLYYRAIPASFSGVLESQVSELPAAVHYLPPIFAAARYWDMESEGDAEESAHAAKWLSYYYQGKNLAKSRLDSASWDIEGWTVA